MNHISVNHARKKKRGIKKTANTRPAKNTKDRARLKEMSKENILEEANRITSVDRRKEYGDVKQSFATIARLWSTVLGFPVTPMQVSLCMIQLKIARQMNGHKRDSLVDIAGYARTAEMIADDSPPLPPSKPLLTPELQEVVDKGLDSIGTNFVQLLVDLGIAAESKYTCVLVERAPMESGSSRWTVTAGSALQKKSFTGTKLDEVLQKFDFSGMTL